MDLTFKLINQGIYGYPLYKKWNMNTKQGYETNYTRVTQRFKINLGSFGKKLQKIKPTCEVYLGEEIGTFQDFKLFPYCRMDRYDNDQGFYIDVNGIIPADEKITVRLKGLRIE